MRNVVPFLLLLLLLAVLLRVDFFFTVVYFLIAVVVLSRLWTRRASDQVRAERRFVSRAFAGDRQTVELTVRNTGWLPIPWLEVGETIPLPLQAVPFRRQVISLGTRERHTFHYTLHCRRRGYYNLGPLHLRTGDLLGIARRDLTWNAPDSMIVYPKIVSLRRAALPTRSPQVTVPVRSTLFEDASRLMGVRDYQRGDSPRRIHWPATARSGRLVVKQYQPAIARDTLLCLDLDQESYTGDRRHEASELAIVAAASLANHVSLREGLPVGLLTAAWDPLVDRRQQFVLPPRSERTHLVTLLETLARVEVAPEETAGFATLIRQARATLSWGTTLVIVTGRLSAELGETLHLLRRNGCMVVLVLVQPGRGRDSPETGIGVPGVPIWRIESEQDLEQGR